MKFVAIFSVKFMEFQKQQLSKKSNLQEHNLYHLKLQTKKENGTDPKISKTKSTSNNFWNG